MTFLLALLLALPAAAASKTISVEPGKPFRLEKGQTARLGRGASLRITQFVNSPCPEGARCIWSGLAVRWELTPPGAPYDVTVKESDYRTYAVFLVAAKEGWTSARRELRLGLLAHLDGKDEEALRHFAACRKLAAVPSPDASSCSIYEDVFGKGKPKGDGASQPGARRAYEAGIAAYRKGDTAAADARWHECLDLSVVASAVRYDCLAAIDLVPKELPDTDEVEARSIYMDGLEAYGAGRTADAEKAWRRCAQLAPAGSGTESDCRAGLDKLKSP